MSWRDRDYNHPAFRDAFSGVTIREWLPPAGTLTILLLHLLAPWFLPRELLLSPVDPVGILIHPLLAPPLLGSLLTFVALWWLGARIERERGTAATIGLYVAGNLVAGLSAYGFARAAPGLAAVPVLPLGALAAWALVLWGVSAWDESPIFGRFFPTRRVLGIAALVLAAYVISNYRTRSLSPLIAGLAGLATGWVFEISRQHQPAASAPRRAERKAVRRAAQPPPSRIEAEPEIDPILAKISREGLASLTDEERALLEAARQAKLRKH